MVDAVVGAVGTERRWDGPRSGLCLMLQMRGALSWMEKVFQRVLSIGVTFPTPRSGHDTNSFLAAPVDVLQWFLLLGNLQGEWPARHSLVSRQRPLVVKRLSEARRF